METAVRVTPGGERLLFVLNHGPSPVDLPPACAGTDLLSGHPVRTLGPNGVILLRD
ncbi:Beta-galactosidase C-terminal domain [Actinoplanes sp. CA-252034]|uniref:Beta-galactosidase C-terminal domain n=1 Tax=Actinoplanes sp. CA-252034 TaxID=3239906 RepID=UPI003D996265